MNSAPHDPPAPVAAVPPPGAPPPVAPVAPPPADPNALTPEEQLDRFAEALKESDWGHQPC